MLTRASSVPGTGDRDGQTLVLPSRVSRRDGPVMGDYKRKRKWFHRGGTGGHWGLLGRGRQAEEAAGQHQSGESPRDGS